MAYGMIVNNGSGNRLLDTTDGVFTVLGFYSVAISPFFYSSSFSHGDLARGTPFFIMSDVPVEGWLGTSLITDINFSGTTCSWYVHESIYSSNDQSGTLSFYYGYF